MRKYVSAFLCVSLILILFSGCFHTHEYGEWKTTQKATCEKDGVRERTCECGETETEVIPATGHDWQDATCESPKKCKNCGETVGEALGHTTDAGKCSRCGEDIGDWQLVDFDNGKGIILKDYAVGKFSNSATTNSKLLVEVRYQSNPGCFFFTLYEYGTKQVKNIYRYSVDYQINIDGNNGGYFHSDGADCFGQGGYGEFFTAWNNTTGGKNLEEWLLDALDDPGHTYTFSMYNEERPIQRYSFTLNSSNFGYLYNQL